MIRFRLRPAAVIDAPPDPGERTLLTQSDLTWLGMWRMPDNPQGSGGWDNSAGRGFTLRRVGGELRAFSTQYEVTQAHNIYEMVVPSTLGATVGAAPQATLHEMWGVPTNVVAGIYNLHWDESLGELWFMGGDSYIDNGDFLCFGRVALNEGSGTLGTSAVWRLNGRSSKFCMHGMTNLPEWYSDLYCPGMTRVLGYGGYESIVDGGPASMGTALTAFNPAQLGASGSALSSTYWKSMVCYPFNPTPYTSPTRMHRDTNYSTTMAFPPYWNPVGPIGYHAEQDYIWGGGIWIDNGTKHGYLYGVVRAGGVCDYVSSDLECDECYHTMGIYDPMDLAEVLQGNQVQDWPQPVDEWEVQFQSLSYPLPGWRALPFQMFSGMCYDATTGRLHVAVKEANGASPNPNPNVVHVYQVAA